MTIRNRLSVASKPAGLHLLCSLIIAASAAGLVFLLWYPYPYQSLSGGRELFLLVVTVDVVCGPLLTFVLFNPTKRRTELLRDLGFVVAIQMAALGYGLWTVWQARPLYLVQEVDRFKVVAAPALSDDALIALTEKLKPNLFGGPKTVAIRKPRSVEEKNEVLFEALEGGRDYAERPEFYIPYEEDAALKALGRAQPLQHFLEKYPDQRPEAVRIANRLHKPIEKMVYLPVRSREDWIAILDDKAMIAGFLKGDGF